ncbi:MAG: prolipoprotein diacylglyceryl transferase [Clostridia bacterium]
MINPNNVAFSVFGKPIYWYGILMALGIIIAIVIASSEAKRKKMGKDAVVDIALWIVPFGIIGARIYYVIFNFGLFANDPISILYIWNGGLAIYGAIIGGILGGIIYCCRKKVPFLRVADIAAPGLVLAQAIGRWGNFFNQEAYGLPVTDPSMYWFPLAVRIDDIQHQFNGVVCSNPYHLATFFYESVWCLLIFILIWSVRKKFKHDGDAFFLYALLYSFERMFVEGLRGDSLYLFNTGIRVSQLLSLIIFVGIFIFFIVRMVKEKKGHYISWSKPYSIEPIPDLPIVEAQVFESSQKTDPENAEDVLKPEDTSDESEIIDKPKKGRDVESSATEEALDELEEINEDEEINESEEDGDQPKDDGETEKK